MDLSYNQIKSLRRLDFKLDKLIKLSLKKNQLQDLLGVENFPKLNYLKLSRNSIKELSEVDRLAELKQLKGVSLYRNPMSENKRAYAAYIIQTCKKLESLDHNSIEEVKKRYMLEEESDDEKSEVMKLMEDAKSEMDKEDLEGSSYRTNAIKCKKNRFKISKEEFTGSKYKKY